MLICPMCGGAMKEVMHFTAEKHYKTKQCKSCYYETKPHRLKLDDIKPSGELMYNNKK